MKTDTIVRDLDFQSDDWMKYYGVHIYCSNCGEHDQVWVKKGVRKNGLSVKCENCKCVVKL